MAVKVGIIGAGDGGLLNCQGLALAGAEIASICDTDEKQLERMRKRLLGEGKYYALKTDINVSNITFTTDIKKVLNHPTGIDLIVIATPDHQHLEPARLAIEAGKYVFVEKPLVTNVKDLVGFWRLAIDHPEKLIFSENHSFARPVEAAMANRKELGNFQYGNTFYTMDDCDRIMGGGKWRTEHAYNPVAGGLSHNFMVVRLLYNMPITRVCADGEVFTYRELERYGGYDTMRGILEFSDGRRLDWTVCLAVRENNSLFGHRCITHLLQFEKGALVYSPAPEKDKLIIKGIPVSFNPEPATAEEMWGPYFIGELYRRMHKETLAALQDVKPRHDIFQGINVAAACILAFNSAHKGGAWLKIADQFIC